MAEKKEDYKYKTIDIYPIDESAFETLSASSLGRTQKSL
jgi:hypothetical protein